MIYHVIRMSISPDVPAEQVQEAMAAMQAAGGNAPGQAGLFGRDVGGEFDFSAVSAYETLEEYEAMMNDPAHLAMDRFGLPLVDRFVSFDVTDDPDPQIHEKIEAIHRRRFDAHPDIAELVSRIDYSGSAAPAPQRG